MPNDQFGVNLALLCVCGGGIIPNALSAVVLVMRRNSIPGARILLGLAVADSGVLLAVGTKVAMELWYLNMVTPEKADPWLIDIVNVYLASIFQGVFFWFSLAGIYLMVALAAGRYIAVNKPHLAKAWNGKSRQRSTLVMIFIVTLLITVPNFFEDAFLHKVVENCAKSLDLPACKQTLYLQNMYMLLYVNIFTIIIQHVIPFPCLLFINIRFLRGLRRFQNQRKRLLSSQTDFSSKKHARVILNVTVILTIFLICQATVLGLWITIQCECDPHNNPELQLLLAQLFTAFNCATNFWVYLAFLKEFRKAMSRMGKRIFRICQLKKEN